MPAPRRRCGVGVLGLLVMLAPALLTTGCFGFRFSIEKTQTQISLPPPGTSAGLTEGRSSYREALARLGAPADIAPLPDGFVFYYFSTDLDEFRLTLSFRGQARFSYADGDQDMRFLALTFGDDGLLRARRGVAGRQNLGSGIAFGHAQTEEGFFGARSYGSSTASPRNRWGARWLRHDNLKLDPTPGGYYWNNHHSGRRGRPGRR